MQPHATTPDPAARRHRPKTFTVFAAAFTAGVALAYGVNRVIDVHVVRVEPQVECEPIFVARESMPQGSPVTIWDVALKDWPKAMLPTTALRAGDSFHGMVLRHPIRKGQPLLTSQLVRDTGALPLNGVAALPPVAPPADAVPATATPPAAAPLATERFIPATPADPRPAAMAAVDRPAPSATPAAPAATPATPTAAPAVPVASAAPTAAPAAIDAPLVAVVPQTVVDPPAITTDPDIDAIPEAVREPAVTDESPAVARVVDIGDEPALDAQDAIAAVDTPAPSAGADVPAWPDVPEPVTAAPSTATTEPSSPLPHTVTMEPTVSAPAGDWHAVAAAADPVPLVAPVPALPSTDIARPLADVGRTVRGSEQRGTVAADASVLDRTTEALPPAQDQRMPVQHLVIPERIALAADSSFTQPTRPASAAPAAETTPAPARPQAAATPATARRPATAQPAARKPSKTQRQPAQKPQSGTPRFWNSWVPPLGGGSRQR